MRKEVWDDNDCNKLLRIDEATPVCGEDFCDDCGDCLDCYWEDTGFCSHRWVTYEKVEK